MWRDLKQKVKKKVMNNQKEVNATGGGPFNQVVLTPNEEDVANLLKYKKQTDPSVGKFYGAPACSTSENVTENADNHDEESFCDLVDTVPYPSKNVQQNQASKRKRPNDKAKMELLEKQNSIQEKLYTEVSLSLTDIKTHLKESNRYQRKLFELQKSKIEKEEGLIEQQRQLMALDLEIKRKNIEVLDAQLLANKKN